MDADYRKALEDLLKLQFELGRKGIQAALEQSRRGGHLLKYFEKPVLAKLRASTWALGEAIVGGSEGLWFGRRDGIFPKQDAIDDGQLGNAIRGPFGIHRAANRRYWFYGAAYELDAQMAYLGNLRRVTEQQVRELVATVP